MSRGQGGAAGQQKLPNHASNNNNQRKKRKRQPRRSVQRFKRREEKAVENNHKRNGRKMTKNRTPRKASWPADQLKMKGLLRICARPFTYTPTKCFIIISKRKCKLNPQSTIEPGLPWSYRGSDRIKKLPNTIRNGTKVYPNSSFYNKNQRFRAMTWTIRRTSET